MTVERRLRAAAEAVDELWSGEDETAERYRRFHTSLQPGPLPDEVSTSIRRLLEGLREEVGASLYFAVYEEGEVRVVAEADGPTTPRVVEWVEFGKSAHAHSFGKCLLAQLDQDTLRHHLMRHRMARLTSRTLTSERVLLDKLRTLYAPGSTFLDLQEYAVGWVSVAVPVGAAGRMGAVAAYLPMEMAHRVRTVGDTLRRLACPALDLALTGRAHILPEDSPPAAQLPLAGDRTAAEVRSRVGRGDDRGALSGPIRSRRR
ncbi:IclR family transcriptional regulator C-terminal domain-containing protein [Streptomyces sp. NPDC046853]|uniref:IclR family transcriptional regulator domain-containing protein n=1 Tax=Streptomyces sp. NPDC046853 TaxID=3154920 RepID=UPI00340B3333